MYLFHDDPFDYDTRDCTRMSNWMALFHRMFHRTFHRMFHLYVQLHGLALV